MPALQRPPSLLELLKAWEGREVTCLASSRINRNYRKIQKRCHISYDPDTLLSVQSKIEEIVDYGLFSCGPFIERLAIIARAVCCQKHQVKEITQYYTYCWVADELLLDDFPGGREWEREELALFNLNTNRLWSTTSEINFISDDALCAIDRLRIYVEAVDDFERDDLYQAITNLTMQWLASQSLRTPEPSEQRAQDRVSSMRARSASMNSHSTRTVPKFGPLTFSTLQNTLSQTLRKLDYLESDSIPPYSNQAPSTQALQISPVFVSAQINPSDGDPSSPATHFFFDSDIDRSRRLLDPTKIALELLELLKTPIVWNPKDPELDKGFLLISQFHLFPGHVRIGRSTRGPRINLPWSCKVLKANEPRATFIWIGSKYSRRVRDILLVELLNKRRKAFECDCKCKSAPDWFEMNLEDAVETANKWVDWIDQEPYYRTGDLKVRYVQAHSQRDRSQVSVLADGIMVFPVGDESGSSHSQTLDSDFAPCSDELPITAFPTQLARRNICRMKGT